LDSNQQPSGLTEAAPKIRGAPHSGFAAAIVPTSARTAAFVLGRPGRVGVERHVHRRTKPLAVPPHDGVGPHDDGDVFRRRVAGMGIGEVVSSPSSPWQNPDAERLIGSIRRECLDHVIVLGERHLRRLLTASLTYDHGARTHLALEKDAPTPPTRAGVLGRTRGRVPGSWRITSSRRTTRRLTCSVDRRLSLDVRPSVWADRRRVCVPTSIQRRPSWSQRSLREPSAASCNGVGKGENSPVLFPATKGSSCRSDDPIPA
jgi:hypothetical protein